MQIQLRVWETFELDLIFSKPHLPSALTHPYYGLTDLIRNYFYQ